MLLILNFLGQVLNVAIKIAIALLLMLICAILAQHTKNPFWVIGSLGACISMAVWSCKNRTTFFAPITVLAFVTFTYLGVSEWFI